MATVLKLGGELLDDGAAVRAAAQAIVRLAATTPLVVVHGGGRAIDAELRARGESPRFADGLRITDEAALDTVVSVLAGRTNTTLVAAIGAAGGRAVGLTGADGRIGLSRRAAPLRTVAGELADLGLVGEPIATDASLLADLVRNGYIPVVASIGVGADGVLEIRSRQGASCEVVIWNPDGSTAGMSGNGTRIAAAWLLTLTGEQRAEIRVGNRTVSALRRDDGLIEQSVGAVRVGPPEPLVAAGETVEVVPVDVGNPHAVVPSASPTRELLLRLGPLLERHDRFPGGTNVQLARRDGPHDVTALVWERGAGETSASGSSAVAVAAVAASLGWCESPVTVHVPGGELVVSLAGGEATLVGPAEEICTGETSF